MRNVAWLVGLVACSEYGISPDKGPSKDSEEEEEEEEEEDDDDDDDDDDEPLDEECDGIDNDEDGEIDEGYLDRDDDGLADCLDSDCLLEVAAASSVTPLAECEGYDPALVTDPWAVTVEWSFDLAGSIVVSPVTGQLTDDNGDGVVDGLDIPDVAFTSYSNYRLYIVSGDGSGEICHQDGWRNDGGVIIADVDGDGRNEVVGPLGSGQVRAVDGACNTEWTTAASYPLLYPVSTAGDLDADGDVEVIVDVAVVDGATGAPVAQLAPGGGYAYGGCWRTPITGDLDQDGDVEIVLGDTVFDSTGAPLWSVPGAGSSCFGAIANLDGDDQAEVIFSYGYDISAYDDNGALRWSNSLPAYNPGPPCAGDIDGDGQAEVIAPAGTQLVAFEANGTQKWSVPMQDSSGAAGCVVFDMNGDEVYEVLFADEVALRVYEGATGAVLYENGTHDSVTYFETPVVADVDNDGSAEMLVVNSPWSWYGYGYGATTGLTVFGHDGSGWPGSGPTWGLHDFSATNQNPDGSIPQNPVAPWLEYNIFRGRPYDDVPGTPNLAVDVVDVCVSSCDPAVGVVMLSAQVRNDGANDGGETTISLYLVSGGADTWYASATIPETDAGEVLESVTFDIALADWTGEFALVVDDDGSGTNALSECFEDDNRASWTGELCN
jgi:hypothetical protein